MKKALCLILSIAMLLCSVPVSFAKTEKNDGELLLATVSDLHYYPESLAKYKGEAFYTYLKAANCVYEDLDAIIDSTLDALEQDAKEKGLKYVVVCGDLTTNGEYEGHIAIAQKLREFEERTGLTVFVINGNHDINNSNASEFTSPDLYKADAKTTSPAEFYEIYRDLGYDDATATYVDDYAKATAEGLPGALSYSVSVEGGYRLIMIDAGKYSKGNTKAEEDEHETAGNITEDLLKWVLAQAKEAQEAGETPIAFTHWNLSEINYLHGELLQGFVIDNAYKLQETFADAGIHYIFSGHQHVSDIDVTYSDAGEPLYSCIVPTLTQYPYQFRETTFTKNEDGSISADFQQYSCDRTKAVSDTKGGVYATPYYITTGLGKQIGDTGSPANYLLNMLKGMAAGYITGIQDSGSIVAFIKDEFGFDLEAWLGEYIKNGIKFEDTELFTLKNIMSFIDDLDNQLCSAFIDNPDELLWPAVQTALENVMAVKVSEVPCTKYIDTYGFGSTEQGGTIGDLFMTVLVNMYPGNEDISDDLFIQDVLKNCGKTEFVDLIFDTAMEYIVNDVVIDVILANTEVHLDALYAEQTSGYAEHIRALYLILYAVINSEIYKPTSFTDFINKLNTLSGLLGNGKKNASYKALAEAVLNTGYISYGKTVDEVLYKLLDTYFGDVQKEATAYQIYVLADGIFNDPDKDWDVTYTYSGAVEVTPTVEDMQLPTDVNMSFGSDAKTSVNIKWMTKYSVTGTDIEIVKANESFTGKITTENVIATTQTSTISAPGFDFGTFGILPWTREVNIHTLNITGLSPNTKYKYRIGDFSKGFVSEGSFTTDGYDSRLTFAFVSDSAGVTPAMYESFNSAVNSAYKNNSLDFIINGGNSVLAGDNEDQWGWSLNGARDALLNVPYCYTSGKGDIGDNSPVSQHFTFCELPDYSTSLYGTYYSFDYANAHFTVINTNELDTDGTFKPLQLKWLDNDLKSTEAEWKILVMNAPLYGENAVNEALQTQLSSLINTYSVQLVLGGSDTAYERSYPIDGGVAVKNCDTLLKKANGKTYNAYANVSGFIEVNGCYTGSLSTGTASTDERFAKSKSYGTPVYTVFNIDGDTLAGETYTVNSDGTGTLIDKFAITKEYTIAKMGDVDINGTVTSADARLALRAAVGLDKLTNAQKIRADVNFSSSITSADARIILRVSVGLEKIVPEYLNYKESELDKLNF